MGKTNEQIIQEFRQFHGEKYDYSKVDYIHSNWEVKIICPKHGVFRKTPSVHKKGGDCPKCYQQIRKNRPKNISRKKNMKGYGKYTNEQVIEQFKNTHGDRYDYSKVKYESGNKRVIVICKKHGEFTIVPAKHKKGKGCPSCENKNYKYQKNVRLKQKRIYKEEIVISKLKEIHSDKYDYSEINYTGSQNKITIICKKHGKFEQNVAAHMKGCGCPKCAPERITKTRTENEKKKLIDDFKKKHGNTYDYNKVNYINSLKKIIITCKNHGDFKIKSTLHKNGEGCPKCWKQMNPHKNRLTEDEVIQRFKNTHGDKYDYSKVKYVNTTTKVAIICPTHGEFQQSPRDHYKGHDCKKCTYKNKRKQTNNEK